MNLFQGAREQVAQFRRRCAADHRRQDRRRSVLHPQVELVQFDRLDIPAAGAREGVANEVLDRRQHSGDQVRVLHNLVRSCHVLQQQPAFTVNEEDLFHPVAQAARQHDLGERPPGAQRLDSPLQGFQRQAAFQRLVDRFHQATQGMGDGLAHCFANDREEGIGQDVGIAGHRDPHRFFDQGIQRLLQRAVPPRAQGDGFRHHLAQLFGAQLAVVEPPLEFFQTRLFRTDDQFPQPRVLAAATAVGLVLRRQVP